MSLSKDQLVSLVLLLERENGALRERLAGRKQDPIACHPATARPGNLCAMPGVALRSDPWTSNGRAPAHAEEAGGRAAPSNGQGSSTGTTVVWLAPSASEPWLATPGDLGSPPSPPRSTRAAPGSPRQRPLAPSPLLRHHASAPGLHTVSCGHLHARPDERLDLAAEPAPLQTLAPKMPQALAQADGGEDVQQSEQQLGTESAPVAAFARRHEPSESWSSEPPPRRSLMRHPSQRKELSGRERAHALMEQKRREEEEQGEECVVS